MERVISTRLVANVSGYVGGMETASRATTSFAQRATTTIQRHSQEMTRVGMAAAAMGLAMGLALRKAARDQIAFESALTKSVTLIGVSRREMDRMGEAALRMGHTGRGPLELADALFFIQSAGLRGATALDTLEQSAKASSIGLGETKVVADLATSAMNAYGSENLSAGQAVDIMVGAVRQGKAEAEDLAGAMGRVLPIASEMGVSFEEVSAATAAMTRTGTDASTSTTQLRAILVSLLNPSQRAERALNGIGLSSQELRDTIQRDGLWNAMMMLREAIGDNDAVLGQVIPNVRALAGFLDLTGSNAADNAQIFAEMADTMGLADEAFEEWSSTSEAAIARFTASAEAARIASMEGLAGPLTFVLDTITSVMEAYRDLPGPVRGAATAMAVLGTAVLILGGGLLILAPRVVATRVALQTLAATAPRAAMAIRGLGMAAGAATAVLALVAAFDMLSRAGSEFTAGSGEVARSLEEIRRGIDTEFINLAADAYDRFSDTIKIGGLRIATNIKDWGSLRHGTKAANDLAAATESVDQVLAEFVSQGRLEDAADSARNFAEAIGVPSKEIDAFVKEYFPQYIDALDGVEAGHIAAAESIDPIEQRLQTLADRFGIVGEEAIHTAQQMVDAWVDAGTRFVDALGAYEDALAEKQQAEEDAARTAWEASEQVSGSWEDMVGDVSLTVDEYIEHLERMVQNQMDWRDNLVGLAGRVSDEMLGYLINLGPEGADLVALYNSMTNEELQKVEGLWLNSTESAVQHGIIDPVADAGPVLVAIGRDLGDDTADAVREYMIKNQVPVGQAAEALGITIDDKMRAGIDREIPVILTGHEQAINNVERVRDAIYALKDKTITIRANGSVSVDGVSLRGRVASGGEIRGPGGPTDDLAGLYALSNREWVIRANSATKYGPKIMDAINRGIAEVRLPGQGGITAMKLNVNFDSSDLGATDFGLASRHLALRAFQHMGTASGRVLPRGSYRIGRGSAAHGYGALDLPAPTGTPIYSVAAGIVTRALRLGYSYGIHSFINHAGGRQSRYAHKSAMYVRTGQQVAAGQLIGRVGSTGNSTGPHLHYEDLINGVRRQPERLGIFDRGGLLQPGYTLAYNGTGGPETVLSPSESQIYDRIMMALRLHSSGVSQPTTPAAVSAGLSMGEFRGNLYLDSGEFLGRVRGMISEHDRDLKERLRSKAGAMR